VPLVRVSASVLAYGFTAHDATKILLPDF